MRRLNSVDKKKKVFGLEITVEVKIEGNEG
jgi:hypothetical protein